MKTVTCPGCGLIHPDLGLPRPPERRMTGECAAEAALVMAAFYQGELISGRQYVIDALACQHPDRTTRRAVQTTALCLMTMDLYFECDQPVGDGSAMHQEQMRTHPDIFVALDAPDLTTALSHRHVAAGPHDEYADRAEQWARTVWAAWAPHHRQVRKWNELTVPHRVR